MQAERWRAIERLFHAALERPTAERAAFLRAECAQDRELCAEVERLLAREATADDLLATFGVLPARGSPRPDAFLGRQLGPYKVVARIADGGMGVVYRAVRADGLYDREVAVKLVRGEVPSEAALRRFDLERRTLASLDHPHIARLYDGGATAEGSPYLVMEYVHGVPVDRWCAEQRLTVPQRLALFVTVCRTVHFAHQNMVVHGDLKPPNILVDRAGSVKLLDFGIARLHGSSEPAERTLTMARMLTPEYASPEQWRGEPLTPVADVYSLGVLLHVLLTGRKPFRSEGLTAGEWERLLVEREPTRPSRRLRASEGGPAFADEPPAEDFARTCASTAPRLAGALRGDLDRIVLMALRKDAARRYASAEALADDVEAHLQGRPVRARDDSLAYRSWTFARRNRWAVSAGAVVVLALTVALLISLRAERLAARDAAHARIEADSFRRIAEFGLEALLPAGESASGARAEALRGAVLEQAGRVRRRQASERHLQANLLDALGLFLLRLDAHADAETLLREALALREAEFGADSLEVALSLASLARLEQQRGRDEPAAELLARALALHRRHSGVHSDVAVAASELAGAWRRLGRLEEARALLDEALALQRAHLGPRNPPVADTLEALAAVRRELGDAAGARALLEEAITIRRETLGEDDPETARTRALLAAATAGS
jgi:eukaryotic-like serine/threonine-protein kinase